MAVHGKDGNPVVMVQAIATGGLLALFNKTDELVVRAYADEYGNGVVGAYDRKGTGNELKPGPQ